MKISGYRILPLVFTLLISLAWMAENAFAAKLREIRTGTKSGFTRLVFQFEAPPRFQVQDKAIPGQFSITFLNTTSGLLPTTQKYAAPVKAIGINQDESHLKAVVTLSIPHFRLKTYPLVEPHRVVFDLYPVAATESLVQLNKLVVKESVEAESTLKTPPPPPAKEPEPPAEEPEPPIVENSQPPALESKPAILDPAPIVREPENSPSVEKASGESSRPTEAPTPPASQRPVKTDSSVNKPTSSSFGTFQRNLIVVLAGISLIILALIWFLLMQRRNNKGKSRIIEPAQELKTTADIMASIDARIKEKFKQYEEADPR